MASEICRLCLNDQQLVYNVFEYNNTKELPDIILTCTSVECSNDDGLPTGACMSCIQMVTQFDVFRKQCQYSDGVLRQKHLESTNKQCKIEDPGKERYQAEGRRPDVRTRPKMIKRNLRSRRANRIQIHKRSREISNCSGDEELFSSLGSDYESSNDNSISNIVVKKKKCRIKVGMRTTRMKDRNCRSHLVYTEQDYAILGRERKVRIWEIDDTMRAIIGNNVYSCEMCMEKFASFFEYFDHQATHNGELVFKCTKCNKVFLTRQNLVEHDARHKIPCKVCELEVMPKSMSAHLLIHTDVHKCPDCGMRHTSNASLEKHVKARHTGIKGFVCHVCGKQSSCQSSMNRHMAYHSSERPYKCKYCDFCAKSLNIVQVHTSRKHFAEKCVCEICAKLFKSQPSLIQHMKRIHTARKHICNICGKAFIERYNLNRHLKKHAGQRLHECKLCHKEFFTIRQLKEHMHSHRQGCVNCPKCGKEFFYKKYYSKHVVKCTKTEDMGSIVDNGNNCLATINF